MNESVRYIFKTIEDAGYEVYIVGGFVRDYLLGIDSYDIDLTTSCPPEVLVKLFPKAILVGMSFGTVKVILPDDTYEITTYRKEFGYSNNRHPDKVAFSDDLTDDLIRRDFTVNAMAMDLNYNIIDLFEGKEDLKHRLIRTVGVPEERFQEDALRMLRAIRFVSKLNGQIDIATLDAIYLHHHSIRKVSTERVRDELNKMFIGPGCDKAIELLISSNLYKELKYIRRERLEFIMDKGIQSSLLKWAMLDLKPVEYQDWKFSNKQVKLLKEMKQLLRSKSLENRHLYFFSRESIELVNEYKKFVDNINLMYNQLPIHNRKEIAVSTDEMINYYNIRPGKWVGELVEEIEINILENKLKNTKDDIFTFLRDRR
jgi:tRNA nucleotidyltransferase (CCA-adding enzyme)